MNTERLHGKIEGINLALGVIGQNPIVDVRTVRAVLESKSRQLAAEIQAAESLIAEQPHMMAYAETV